MSQRIVITGAAGRIGSVVAQRLAADGHGLVLLDRKRGDVELPPATFLEIDLRDRDRVVAAIGRADTIVHVGELPGIAPGSTGDEVFASNTAVCRSMLDAALETGATRFIYTSSCQQYGYWGADDFDRTRTPARWPLDELLPAAPRNAYAHSKAVNELTCRETSARTNLEIFLFRFPYVVPHGRGAGLRTSPISRMDGFWTYLAIDDAAEAYALAVRPDRPLERLPSRCEAFHFVADDIRGERPIRENLAASVPDFAPLPADWPMFSPPVSCVKAACYLGWHPSRKLVDRVTSA